MHGRTGFILLISAALALATNSTSLNNSLDTTNAAPHIIFILADDLGWNDVSYHGSPQFQTPNIDALAAEGVALERYYATATCSPTRASVMSGRSLIHHGIFVPYNSIDTASGLNLSYSLLSDHLQQSYGYTTAMLGKWHLGMKTHAYLPSHRGFNYSFCFYQGMLDYWKHYNDMCSGGATCSGLDLHENYGYDGATSGGSDSAGVEWAVVNDTDVYHTVGDYSSDMFTRKAVELITKHGFLGVGNGYVLPPLFLYLAYQAIHSGNNKFLQAPDAYFHLPDIESLSPDYTCGQYETTSSCIGKDPSGSGKAARKSAAAQVRSMDDGVGDLVKALQRSSMWDNTLLVWSSDNGGPTDGQDNNMANNFPLRGCKGGYFDGGLRVPAFVSGGSSLIGDDARGSSVYSGVFHATDWLPSLLTAAKRGATGDEKAHHTVVVKDNERPFLKGDGVDNWDFIASGGLLPSARTEIIHAAQAQGSDFAFTSLLVGDMKLLIHPAGTDCGATRAGWYPPPGEDWNYANLTLNEVCGEPPADRNPPINSVCTSQLPCVFNLTADPCEHVDLGADEAYASVLEDLQAALLEYQATTVLPYTVFSKDDANGDPRLNAPIFDAGTYAGVWRPWLTDEDDAALYPTHYEGPGYP